MSRVFGGALRRGSRSAFAPYPYGQGGIKCELEVCKRRDPKGLYKKAVAGEIKDFTGVDSPYEVPANPEITAETDIHSVESIIEQLEGYLRERAVL